MTAPPDSADPARLTYLDGLRGLLAFCVVFSHAAAFGWMPTGFGLDMGDPNPLEWTLWNLGAPAVDAFYVMSGLVVALSIEQRPKPYGRFIKARFRRLMPMMALGLALGLLAIRPLAHWLPPATVNSAALQLTTPLQLQDYLGIATLGLIDLNDNAVNWPLWSITVELHLALLMPLLLTLVTRLGWGMLGVLVLLTCFLTITGALYGSWWFIPAFTFGILIRHLKVSQPAAWILLVSGLLLWQHRQWTGESIFYRHTSSAGAAMFITALGSLPAQSAVIQLLNHPAAQRLGQLSFSIYATHMLPLTLGAAAAAQLGLNPVFGAALLIPLTIPTGQLAYRYIEQRFSLGQKTTHQPASDPATLTGPKLKQE